MSEIPQAALVFEDIEPIEVLVKVRGKHYLLCEASTDAILKYRNANARAARMVDGRVVGVGDVADAEPLLISECLFTVPEQDGTPLLDDQGRVKKGVKVPPVTVRSWRGNVTRDLFDEIKRISPGLDDKLTPEHLKRQLGLLIRQLSQCSPEDRTAGIDLLRRAASAVEEQSTLDSAGDWVGNSRNGTPPS